MSITSRHVPRTAHDTVTRIRLGRGLRALEVAELAACSFAIAAPGADAIRIG